MKDEERDVSSFIPPSSSGYAQTLASGGIYDWRDIPCYLTEADLEIVPPR
jgi:hypothetical protein